MCTAIFEPWVERQLHYHAIACRRAHDSRAAQPTIGSAQRGRRSIACARRDCPKLVAAVYLSLLQRGLLPVGKENLDPGNTCSHNGTGHRGFRGRRVHHTPQRPVARARRAGLAAPGPPAARGARAGAGRGHRPDEEDKCEKHGGGSTETDIARCESPLVDPAASSARIASVPLE